jgi:hypothetical protein
MRIVKSGLSALANSVGSPLVTPMIVVSKNLSNEEIVARPDIILGLVRLILISTICGFIVGLGGFAGKATTALAAMPSDSATDPSQVAAQETAQRWADVLGDAPSNNSSQPRPSVGQQSSNTGPGRWRRVTSRGLFSVELPEGWQIKQQDSVSASFAPVGRQFPEMSILGWVPAGMPGISLLRPCQQQVSAQDSVIKVLLPLIRQLNPALDIKIENMDPRQPSARALVVGRVTYQGQPLRFLSVVSMEYVLNPAFTAVLGCQAWYSFGFVGTIAASPKELDALVPVAGRILSTFATTPLWDAEIRAKLLQAIQTQLAMVGQSLDRITRMQMEQQMKNFEAIRRVGQMWGDVLGGIARTTDPTGTIWPNPTVPTDTIPPYPTKWWRCPWSYEPIPSGISPGSGCYEVPAPVPGGPR